MSIRLMVFLGLLVLLSSGATLKEMNTHWPEKSLTMQKINHENDFVRLA